MLDRVRVQDRTVLRGPAGTTTNWAPRRGAPLRCRFGQVTDAEAQTAAGLVEGKAATAVTFPVGTVVKEGTRLVNASTGRLWQVIADVTPDSTAWRTGVRVLAREV